MVFSLFHYCGYLGCFRFRDHFSGIGYFILGCTIYCNNSFPFMIIVDIICMHSCICTEIKCHSLYFQDLSHHCDLFYLHYIIKYHGRIVVWLLVPSSFVKWVSLPWNYPHDMLMKYAFIGVYTSSSLLMFLVLSIL